MLTLKEYVICEEYISGYSCYTIRTNTDCSPARFKVIADFDTYEEADKFLKDMFPFEDIKTINTSELV